MSQKVIDISGWQHPDGAGIDWGKVKAAGYVGVIIKATQGVHYKNPHFEGDYNGARAAGLMTGAFHFADPATGDVEAEATWFAEAVNGKTWELGLWYDLERSGGEQWFTLETRVTGFVAHVGTPPAPAGLYANLDYCRHLGDVPHRVPLWLANPSNIGNDFAPVIVQRHEAPVDGIVGPVDQDELLAIRWVNPPGPPAPAPAPAKLGPHGEPELRQGATGSWVEDLQDRLNRLGDSLAVDGSFGPKTLQGVLGFQNDHGLVEDGIVGPLTWGALDDLTDHVLPAPGPQPAPAPDQPQISRGAKGDAVRVLQARLNLFGAGLAVDGDFGPATEHALRQFQASHSLVNDGIAGPLTWGVLLAG